MINPIVRMYDSAHKAAAAAAKLKDAGYTDDLIDVISAAATGPGDALMSALMAAYVVRNNAALHARLAGASGAFVVVRPPFGAGVDAIEILNGCGPVSDIDPTEVKDGALWDDAAPFSSALNLRVLSAWRPSGGIGTLTDSRWSLFGSLGLAELSASNAPTTEAMGMSLLSSGSTPFSSLLKLPVLK